MNLLVNALNALASVGFDLLVLPGAGRPPLEAAAVGLAAGVLASLTFWWTAPRASLSRALTSLSTDLLEIWLYRRLPRVVLRAELHLLTTNLRLLAALLAPLTVSALAVAPLLVQSHYRFGLLPARIDQPLLVTVEVDGAEVDLRDSHLSLIWLEGEGQVLGPVRHPPQSLATWRLRPQRPGSCRLELGIDGWQGQLPLQVGAARGSLAPSRLRAALPRLLEPRGRPLEPSSPVVRMTASYPPAPATWMIWLGLGSTAGAGLVALARRKRSA